MNGVRSPSCESVGDDPDGWLVPAWPAPKNVRAVFTSRAGGVSRGPWRGLNVGAHVGDAPAAVQANRAQLAQTIGASPLYLEQVHGSAVVRLPSACALPVADAVLTAQAGPVCCVMVADCLAVLLTDSAGRVVGAAHAGWRGLAGVAGRGVLESFFDDFKAIAHGAYDFNAINTIAWLGPCIGPTAFEVGGEVRAAFTQCDAGAARFFRAAPGGKWWADLAGLARRRLQALGLTHIYGNDGSDAWCTARNPSRFFSHRRDHAVLGGSGRMAACIWLT